MLRVILLGPLAYFFGKYLFSRFDRRTRSSGVQVQLGVKVELKSFTTSTQIENLGDVSGVFWDVVSCSIQMSDHKKAIEYITNEVETFEMSSTKIHVYGDSTKLPATIELRRVMGTTYTETSHTKEEVWSHV